MKFLAQLGFALVFVLAIQYGASTLAQSARDAVVLTPTKLYDLIESLQKVTKNHGDRLTYIQAQEIGEIQRRIVRLERAVGDEALRAAEHPWTYDDLPKTNREKKKQ